MIPVRRPTAFLWTLAVLAFFLAPPSPAQEPAAEEPLPTLAASVDPEEDARLAEGLGRRLAQLPGLREITVAVEAGVVTLRGEAISAAAIEEAEAIARRTEGVAQVVVEIEEITDVTERVMPTVEKLRELGSKFLAYLPLLGIALLVVAGFAFLARLAGRGRLIARLTPNRFVAELVTQAVRTAIVLAGVLIALDILEATALVGAVLGAAGVLGLALGFAFRDLIENYVSSVLLSVRQPFAPNDHVKIDDYEGKVVRLTSRATILMTLDGNHLRIPNSQVFKGVILNYTRNPLRRFDFAVGVGVEEDLVEAQRLGIEVLERLDGVLADPAPTAVISGLGDSSVQVCFLGWVDQRRSSFLLVKGEAIREVKTALESAGMDLPEPIYRVHMVEAKPRAEPRPQPPQAEPRPEPRPAEPSEPVADAAAVEASVDRQIAEDRATSGEGDLLDPAAPQE